MNGNVPQALGDRIFGRWRKICEQGEYAPKSMQGKTHEEKLNLVVEMAQTASSFEEFADKLEGVGD